MKNKIVILIVSIVFTGALGYRAIDARKEAEAWKREANKYEQLALQYEQLYLKCKNQ